MAATIFPELREELRSIRRRKPDPVIVNMAQNECKIIEVPLCFVMYMEQSYMGKLTEYREQLWYKPDTRLIIIFMSWFISMCA